jgi:hypothetical protein
MAVDGILVTLLTQAPGVLFGFTAALVLFRVSSRKAAQGGYIRRSFRLALRSGGAVALFAATVSSWSSARGRFETGLAHLGGAKVEAASDEGERVESANAIRAGADLAGLDVVADSLLAPAPPAADSLSRAVSEMDQLRLERDRLRRRVDALEEAQENSGLVAMMKRFADDLGLGLGWMGLYFTATVALWRGQTPGKRLFGIRVIRLDGKPIGWWVAFERTGGYWAGVATGLLGFLQILWDRNRQGIHDKITETAVIRG